MPLTGLAPAERTLFRGAVSTSVEGETTIIAWRGHVDVTTLPSLIDAVADAGADRTGPVVIDLGEADFIDTASVCAIGSAAQDLALDERRMTVRSPSRVALMLLATLGFSALVEPAAELAQ